MKRMFVILLFSFAIAAYAQSTYKVIKVTGEIEIVKTGQDLTTGLEFSENEKLDFKSRTSKAAVINSKKGRMILTYNENSPNKSNYLPPMGNVSTRGGIITNIIDLKNHFKGELVLLEQIVLDLPLEDFSMDEHNFFYFQYEFEGEEINKRLASDSIKLIINKKELFTIDGEVVDPPNVVTIRMYYYNEKQESNYIGEFVLILPELETLQKEIKVLLDEMEGKSKEEKVTEVNAFIIDFYGRVDLEDVNNWMKRVFNL